MKLSGWLRLWILLSGLLFLLVAAGAYELLPTPSDVPDSAELQAALSPEARAQIADGEGADDGPRIRMPNGHIIHLKKGIESRRSTLALAEYNSAIDRRLWLKRIKLMGGALALWLSICGGLYGVAWSVGWVYQGFRGSNNIV